MNIHDHITYRSDGTWHAKYEHRTTRSPERNYGTGTTQYMSCHKNGWDAVMALVEYCNKETIVFAAFDGDTWKRYYDDCDKFIAHMISKKDSTPRGEWEMSFSCDAPNKPGYFRANND